MKGPAIFLAQFMDDKAPFNDFGTACQKMTEFGYEGVQIPTWDSRCVDLQKLAESKTYADEFKGTANQHGIQITELSTHLQGQLIATHPAYNKMYDGFAPAEVQNNAKARSQWAKQQLFYAAKASANLGLDSHVSFSGSLLWPYMYPWPQRPAGLVEEGFKELAKKWIPILNEFDNHGVDVCFELHPGEDLHDGHTFERFLEVTNNHKRANILYDPSHFVLQQLDYLQFIDFYHDRIKMFHVKDAEFNPTGKCGVYGGYLPWTERAGRFRSLGDGQIDFTAIFSKLAQYNFEGWPVVEWECCIKDSMVGAHEGATFVRNHIIKKASRSFDDFANAGTDEKTNRLILGIED
jgi:sugar phosphate isomerase/epimerase